MFLPSDKSFGNLEDGECDYDLTLWDAMAVEVTCHAFLDNPLLAETAATSISTAVFPKIQLGSQFMFDKNNTMAVMAGEESMLTCIVAGAPPKPAVICGKSVTQNETN